jgi:hypothetical protein
MPQVTTTKTRVRNLKLNTGVRKIEITVPPQFSTDATSLNDVMISGIYESVTSVGHKGPPFKEGGPFYLKRFSIERDTIPLDKEFVQTRSSGTITKITSKTHGRVPILASPSGAPYIDGYPKAFTAANLKAGFDAISTPPNDLASYGATAIARYSPLKPGVNLGQTVGELLKEGIPTLPLNLKKRLEDLVSQDSKRNIPHRLAKGAAQDYLNVVFGWRPLVQDLRQMYNTFVTVQSRIEQIIRDNGRPVRRRGRISRTVSSSVTPFSGTEMTRYVFIPPIFGSTSDSGETGSDSRANGSKRIVTSTDITFSGRFRYYLPKAPDNRWTTEAGLALFGLNPSPSLVYELMPWSWLIDWFSNLGDVITNWSSNGIADLIIDYGYVMRHYRKVTTYDVLAAGIYSNTAGWTYTGDRRQLNSPLSTRIVEEVKERVVATPFGFGLHLADLSDRQAAILVALGLSLSNFQ